MKHQIKQRGFTLIELLVVVAIMGTLLGLVAISNRPSRKTQLRMAAQSVASLVVAAQSTALDSEVGSALWISSDGVYDANPQQNQVEVVQSVTDQKNNPSIWCTLNFKNGVVVSGDAFRVRFKSWETNSLPSSVWYGWGIKPYIPRNNDEDARAHFITEDLNWDRELNIFDPDIPNYNEDINENKTLDESQTPLNTIWPARFYSNPSSPNCSAEFDLYPQQTGLAYQWPKLAKIDWRYSGIGGNAPLAADAVLAFDGGGKIETYFTAMPGSTAYKPAMSTLYLCIAYAPDVDAGKETLKNEDTVWVAIEPSVTRATLAWNVPTTLNDPNSPTTAELLAARANVIAGKGLAD